MNNLKQIRTWIRISIYHLQTYWGCTKLGGDLPNFPSYQSTNKRSNGLLQPLQSHLGRPQYRLHCVSTTYRRIYGVLISVHWQTHERTTFHLYSFTNDCHVSCQSITKAYHQTHHCFLRSAISYHDCIFMSTFWQDLFKIWGTSLKHSTTYHIGLMGR